MSSAIERACNEIVRRYQRAGFSIAAAQEQAERFSRSFNRIGDHQPDFASDAELDAALDRIQAAIG